MDKTHIKYCIDLASKKGISVKKNTFGVGWSISLPNGVVHNEPSDHGMAKYVKGY